MSNPVVSPPPASDGSFPPPPAPGTQPGAPVPPPVAPPAKKGNSIGKLALRIVLALVVGLGVFAVKSFVFGDKAKDAAVGDCIAASEEVTTAESTETEAEVVDCSAADAAYTVVGRVDGETSLQSESCDKYFKEDEEFVILASESGSAGYLLCLKPKA